MLCITDTTTDPYWNLAAEEYLLVHCDAPVFRLWRNEPSVIIGRYQNAMAEINTEYVRRNRIPVVRRLTGGGAVFHDLGNLNYTFIDTKRPGEDSAAMFRRFTAPIVAALRTLGIDAALEGRNDLVIREHDISDNQSGNGKCSPDGCFTRQTDKFAHSECSDTPVSRKFSGNAICVHNGRVLQHGTLLFSASMNSLAEALNTRPEKFIGKSVQSNRSRVTNISEHLPSDRQMDIGQFMEYLREFVIDWDFHSDTSPTSTTGHSQDECRIQRRGGRSSGMEVCSYDNTALKIIKKLRDTRYSTEEWNFGHSPKYSFSNTFKLPCGLFEIFLDVRGGIISDCKIMGDYFFLRPTEDICTALIGKPHTYEAILATLSGFPMAEYFGADIAQELAAHML